MLREGDFAPDFHLQSTEDRAVSLSEYRGRWVLLYFYPKDMTPGCTQEACSFRDDFSEYSTKNIIVLGVSRDSIEDHDRFVQKYELPFLLLSDESGELCEIYGVWKEKKMYGKSYMGIDRTSFLIDPDGKIKKIFQKVQVKGHSQEVLSLVG